MSDQGKKANEFIRRKLGAKPDAAAGNAGLRVVDGNGGDGDDEHEGKPWIELPGPGRQLRAFAHEMGNELAKHAVFRREKYPVMVNEETGMIEVIEPDEFISLAEEYTVPHKVKAVKGGYENEPMSMTTACARATLKAAEFWSALRKIERVNLVRMPVRRGGAGGLPALLATGYDEETRTYTLESDIKLDETLKPEEGQAIIKDYVSEFPFPDARSKAVAVAGMVALYAAQMQETTASRMSFVYRSNVEGAGKSLIAQVAITPSFGLAEGQPLASREELRKLLDATAMNGSPYLFLDNLVGHVKSELLDSYLTTPIWTGRVLGTPKIFKAPANAMLFVTGNNITLSNDLARRSLVCNLVVEEADPDTRQPKRVMTPQFLAKPHVRGDLLSAMWAMIRGWHQAGGKPGVRRLRSFEEWSDLIGGIVMWNGFGDPLEKPKDEESAAPHEVHKRQLVDELVSMIPAGASLREYRFDEILDVCRHENFFDWLIDGRIVKKREKLDDGTVVDSEVFEAKKETTSALGRIFGKEMAGQKYTTKDGKRVQFGKRGEARHRRYQLIMLKEEPKQ